MVSRWASRLESRLFVLLSLLLTRTNEPSIPEFNRPRLAAAHADRAVLCLACDKPNPTDTHPQRTRERLMTTVLVLGSVP